MDYRSVVKPQSPPSSYAVADLLNRRAGAVAKVATLTLKRSFFIGTGLYIAGIKDEDIARGALVASATITAWIIAAYWLKGKQR